MDLLNEVSKYTGVDVIDMKSQSRIREICFARHLYHYAAMVTSSLSLKRIGELTNRDHTTVLHSIRAIENMRECDSDYRRKIDHFIKKIKLEKENKKTITITSETHNRLIEMSLEMESQDYDFDVQERKVVYEFLRGIRIAESQQ